MNLFKRTTASIALVALVSGVFSTGVSAYDASELVAANALAAKGYINSQNDASGYNLDATITRAEMAKVAANIAGLTPTSTCENKFADISATTPNDWVCGYAEALLANGLVSANANYNPNADISKSEAVKLMLSAAGEVVSFNDATWQADHVNYAVENGFVASFTDYNTSADRGFVFGTAAAATTEDEDEDDILSELEDLLAGDDDEDEDDDVEIADETPAMSGDDVLEVTLSADTADSATVPGSVNGLPAASFDFTAGSEDVTVTQISVKRTGLSDKDTLLSLAVFTSEGRASNEKNDNQENDTEAQLNLADGGVVVKAGETRTLTIVVDLNTAANAGQDEFALELINVVASSTVEGLGDVKANTIRIGSVDAPTLVFTPGSNVSNPTLGEEDADIFEFEVDGDNNEDVVLKSITFEGSNNSEDDLANFKLYFNNDLVAETASMNDDFLTFNIEGGITIREDKNEDFLVTADIIEGAGDTITFVIDEALDVTAESTKFGYGAAVNINAVDATNDLGSIKIEAGELTIVEVEPDFDEIREDKNNVVIGGFKLTNVAGQNLELKEFGVRIAFNAGTTGFTKATEFLDDVELYNEETGSSYELTTSDTDLDAVFSENSIDVVIPQGTTIWSIRADTAENITNFDSASFVLSFTTGQISATTGGFLVEETEDDTVVTDISPSSVSFNTIDGSESGATASLVPLSDITAVRGASDIVALQFEIEAEESSFVTVDEIVAKIAVKTPSVLTAATATSAVVGDLLATADTTGTAANGYTVTIVANNGLNATAAVTSETATAITVEIDGDSNPSTWNQVVTALNAAGTFTATVTSPANGADTVLTGDAQVMTLAGGLNLVTIFSSTNLPSKSIASVKLFKGSVSDANLLDQESGSNIANDGTVSFNDFNEVRIDANATETFIITVSFVDGQDTVDNAPFTTTLTSVSVEDDDNDDVAVTTNLLSSRDISISGFGVITLTEDNNNEDNEDNKTLLAGANTTVFSVDVQSTNESMDVETVVFTIAGATNLNNSMTNASLYLDNALIDTNSNSDITNTSITFDNISGLIIEEMTSELKLVFNTETIGYQKVGATDVGITITNVALSDTQGVSSGKDAANVTLAVTSKTIDIVPAVITASVSTSLNSSATPLLKLTSDVDGNTVDASNSTANVLVNTVTFSTLGTSSTDDKTTYTLTNLDDSSDTVVVTDLTDGADLVFNVSANLTTANRTISSSSSETFKITVTGTLEGDTVTLVLKENGVAYDVSGTANSTGLSINMANELDFGSRSY